MRLNQRYGGGIGANGFKMTPPALREKYLLISKAALQATSLMAKWRNCLIYLRLVFRRGLDMPDL